MMTFISTFSLLIIFVSSLRIKKQENLFQRQSLSHCMNSLLTSSQQKGEFSAWLQQKEELNSQVETVCRQTGGHTNIGTNSFMYVEAANLLFCLNQKVSPTSFSALYSVNLSGGNNSLDILLPTTFRSNTLRFIVYYLLNILLYPRNKCDRHQIQK